jgi:hypothetical protein
MRAGEPALGYRPVAAIFVSASRRHRSQASPWAVHGTTATPADHIVLLAAVVRF